MLEELLNAKRKAVGVKQTIKAVQNGEAKVVSLQPMRTNTSYALCVQRSLSDRFKFSKSKV